MNKITIFMYHDIRDFHQAPFPKRYEQKSFIRHETFRKQLDSIQKNFRIISVSELKKLLGEKNINQDYAVLTFDDGLRDHYEITSTLIERNIKGCFYVPAEPIEKRRIMKTIKIQFVIAENDMKKTAREILSFLPESERNRIWEKYSVSAWKDNYWPAEQVFISNFLRNHTDREQARSICDHLFNKYVTKDELSLADDLFLSDRHIREMLSAGMEIGAHGYTSDNLINFTEEEVKRDVKESKRFLNKFGVTDLFYSYPNGGFNDMIIRTLQSEGFSLGIATMNQKIHNLSQTDPYTLPRIDASQLFKI